MEGTFSWACPQANEGINTYNSDDSDCDWSFIALLPGQYWRKRREIRRLRAVHHSSELLATEHSLDGKIEEYHQKGSSGSSDVLHALTMTSNLLQKDSQSTTESLLETVNHRAESKIPSKPSAVNMEIKDDTIVETDSGMSGDEPMDINENDVSQTLSPATTVRLPESETLADVAVSPAVGSEASFDALDFANYRSISLLPESDKYVKPTFAPNLGRQQNDKSDNGSILDISAKKPSVDVHAEVIMSQLSQGGSEGNGTPMLFATPEQDTEAGFTQGLEEFITPEKFSLGPEDNAKISPGVLPMLLPDSPPRSDLVRPVSTHCIVLDEEEGDFGTDEPPLKRARGESSPGGRSNSEERTGTNDDPCWIRPPATETFMTASGARVVPRAPAPPSAPETEGIHSDRPPATSGFFTANGKQLTSFSPPNSRTKNELPPDLPPPADGFMTAAGKRLEVPTPDRLEVSTPDPSYPADVPSDLPPPTDGFITAAGKRLRELQHGTDIPPDLPPPTNGFMTANGKRLVTSNPESNAPTEVPLDLPPPTNGFMTAAGRRLETPLPDNGSSADTLPPPTNGFLTASGSRVTSNVQQASLLRGKGEKEVIVRPEASTPGRIPNSINTQPNKVLSLFSSAGGAPIELSEASLKKAAECLNDETSNDPRARLRDEGTPAQVTPNGGPAMRTPSSTPLRVPAIPTPGEKSRHAQWGLPTTEFKKPRQSLIQHRPRLLATPSAAADASTPLRQVPSASTPLRPAPTPQTPRTPASLRRLRCGRSPAPSLNAAAVTPRALFHDSLLDSDDFETASVQSCMALLPPDKLQDDSNTEQRVISLAEFARRVKQDPDSPVKLLPAVVAMNPQSAASFVFRRQDYRDDDWPEELDAYFEVGSTEFVEAIRACESPKAQSYLSNEWGRNHYRWVVWKLSSLERFFGKASKGCLLPITVLAELRYRYEREFLHGSRSHVRQLYNRDVHPSRPIVLLVADLLPPEAPGRPWNVDLSDGWYAIRACLDDRLCALLHRKKIFIGQKLFVAAASFRKGEPCEPLESAAEDTILQLSANGVRPARWDARLGFSRVPLSLKVFTLYPDGGIVPCVVVRVVRPFPLVFQEKTGSAGARQPGVGRRSGENDGSADGGWIHTRTKRGEQRMMQQAQLQQDRLLERLRNMVMKEVADSPSFQTLGPDDAQREFDRRMDALLAEDPLPERNLSTYRKLLVVDASVAHDDEMNEKHMAIITLWSPHAEGDYQEGSTFRIGPLYPMGRQRQGGRLQLKAGRSTIVSLLAPSDANSSNGKTGFYPPGDVFRLSRGFWPTTLVQMPDNPSPIPIQQLIYLSRWKESFLASLVDLSVCVVGTTYPDSQSSPKKAEARSVDGDEDVNEKDASSSTTAGHPRHVFVTDQSGGLLVLSGPEDHTCGCFPFDLSVGTCLLITACAYKGFDRQTGVHRADVIVDISEVKTHEKRQIHRAGLISSLLRVSKWVHSDVGKRTIAHAVEKVATLVGGGVSFPAPLYSIREYRGTLRPGSIGVVCPPGLWLPHGTFAATTPSVTISPTHPTHRKSSPLPLRSDRDACQGPATTCRPGLELVCIRRLCGVSAASQCVDSGSQPGGRKCFCPSPGEFMSTLVSTPLLAPHFALQLEGNPPSVFTAVESHDIRLGFLPRVPGSYARLANSVMDVLDTALARFVNDGTLPVDIDDFPGLRGEVLGDHRRRCTVRGALTVLRRQSFPVGCWGAASTKKPSSSRKEARPTTGVSEKTERRKQCKSVTGSEKVQWNALTRWWWLLSHAAVLPPGTEKKLDQVIEAHCQPPKIDNSAQSGHVPHVDPVLSHESKDSRVNVQSPDVSTDSGKLNNEQLNLQDGQAQSGSPEDRSLASHGYPHPAKPETETPPCQHKPSDIVLDWLCSVWSDKHPCCSWVTEFLSPRGKSPFPSSAASPGFYDAPEQLPGVVLLLPVEWEALSCFFAQCLSYSATFRTMVVIPPLDEIAIHETCDPWNAEAVDRMGDDTIAAGLGGDDTCPRNECMGKNVVVKTSQLVRWDPTPNEIRAFQKDIGAANVRDLYRGGEE
eukprot:Rmarinus@m.811